MTTRVLTGAIRRVAQRTKSTWDDRIIERKVFSRLSHAVPAVIIYYGIGPALGVSAAAAVAAADPAASVVADPAAFFAGLTERVALAFIVLTATMAVSALLNAINDIYNESYTEAKSQPIKGYLQVVGMVLYVAQCLCIVGKPLLLLRGYRYG